MEERIEIHCFDDFLLQTILSSLKPVDLVRAAGVCRRWRNMIDSIRSPVMRLADVAAAPYQLFIDDIVPARETYDKSISKNVVGGQSFCPFVGYGAKITIGEIREIFCTNEKFALLSLFDVFASTRGVTTSPDSLWDAEREYVDSTHIGFDINIFGSNICVHSAKHPLGGLVEGVMRAGRLDILSDIRSSLLLYARENFHGSVLREIRRTWDGFAYFSMGRYLSLDRFRMVIDGLFLREFRQISSNPKATDFKLESTSFRRNSRLYLIIIGIIFEERLDLIHHLFEVNRQLSYMISRPPFMGFKGKHNRSGYLSSDAIDACYIGTSIENAMNPHTIGKMCIEYHQLRFLSQILASYPRIMLRRACPEEFLLIGQEYGIPLPSDPRIANIVSHHPLFTSQSREIMRLIDAGDSGAVVHMIEEHSEPIGDEMPLDDIYTTIISILPFFIARAKERGKEMLARYLHSELAFLQIENEELSHRYDRFM